MEVSFELFCLTLTAKIVVHGEHRQATFWEPEEYPELEIHDLRCDGKDAYFLLNSDDLRQTIYETVWDAFEKQCEEHNRLCEEDRAQDLFEERSWA